MENAWLDPPGGLTTVQPCGRVTEGWKVTMQTLYCDCMSLVTDLINEMTRAVTGNIVIIMPWHACRGNNEYVCMVRLGTGWVHAFFRGGNEIWPFWPQQVKKTVEYNNVLVDTLFWYKSHDISSFLLWYGLTLLAMGYFIPVCHGGGHPPSFKFVW